MAIPSETLSSQVLDAPFRGPRALSEDPLEDFELGGVGLNDTSKGLQFQTWTGTCDGSTVTLKGANGVSSVIYEGVDITEISFTFDQNMRPMLAFVEGGVAKYQWFDTQAQQQVVTLLPAGSITPRVSLDDKRQLQNNTSDIILAYINNSNLYYRQQRDRYEIERLLAEDVTRLVKVGMNTGLRFQFELLRSSES